MKETLKINPIIPVFLVGIIAVACGPIQENNDTTQAEVPYEASWPSLSRHQAVPDWLADAKLGIYFHWGPYSVPAFAHEWYPAFMFKRGTGIYDHHVKTYGDPSEFGYHDFIPLFKAEHFDPEDWADLFVASGARFAGPVAQHHDGFAMWASEVNPWNAADMGPEKDILGQMFASLKKRNIKTIATFHHAKNGPRNVGDTSLWFGNSTMGHFPYDPAYPTSSTDPELSKLYGNHPSMEAFHDYWLAQINEVVNRYSPDMIWFDSWLNLIPEDYRMRMVANYLNKAQKNQQQVALGYKERDLPYGVGILDFEQGGRREMNEQPWMTDVTLGDGRPWNYVEGMTYKTPELVIRNMVDVWSKNGVVLLNISPRADGVIPNEQREILLEIGRWMKKHAEAIYGTRAHSKNGFGTASEPNSNHDGQSAKVEYTGKDIRFTLSKDRKTLYAFVLGKPAVGSVISVPQFKPHRHALGKVINISLIGSDQPVVWEQTTYEFRFTVPDAGLEKIANVFKIEAEPFL